MNILQTAENARPDDEMLYGAGENSPLSASVRRVLQQLIGSEEACLLGAAESLDVLKTEVCTACKRHSFMACDGDCSQDCELLQQVLSDESTLV